MPNVEAKDSRTKRVKTQNKNNLVISKIALPIIAIGASTGGLEALEAFFKHLTSEVSAAFVVITPGKKDSFNRLPGLLKKYTKMPVMLIKNNAIIQPNIIYIIDPSKTLNISRNVFKLSKYNEEKTKELPIDHVFRILASDSKLRKIVGVILSGDGTDGTRGLRAIHAEGGLTIAQDPKLAKASSMPAYAIKTGIIDYILPPEKMSDSIFNYLKLGYKEASLLKNTSFDVLQQIFTLVQKYSGHDFSFYKKNTIWRRIEKRMSVHQISYIATYVRYLQQHPQEINVLFKEFLIGVTCFFRDTEAFAILKNELLSRVIKNKAKNSCIRVWIPGCSSGEEVYSIAIILLECMSQVNKYFDIQIFGTDIDESAIEVARCGIYPTTISADMSAERLSRYFKKEGNAYKINKDIRKMIIFAPQSIIKDPPFTKLDLICCRNLMIYLNAHLQKKILPLFHYSLKPGGLLFLGTAENLGENTNLFNTINKKWKIFERKGGQSTFHIALNLPIATQRIEIADMKNIEKNEKLKQYNNISQHLEKILLEHYAPACVVINEKNEIIYIHGRTGSYLEPAPGKANLNILEMVRPSLKIKLSSAIRKAFTQQQEIYYHNLHIENNGISIDLNLRIKPLGEIEHFQKTLLVIFENVNMASSNIPKTPSPSTEKHESQLTELEQELNHTKETLQITIEELETSNEELKSSNEELQSTNEELQSTNEEIETSKEELQSVNEELATVNTELQHRIDQLSNANDDMMNILDSTDISTIFLDNELCVKRFTPRVKEVINLILSDVGRPIHHIVSNLKYDELVSDAQRVLDTLTSKIVEVENKDGCWYRVKIIPYRTLSNKIEGVVITFLNINQQKQVEQRLEQYDHAFQDATNYSNIIMQTMHEPLLLLDNDLKIIATNAAFSQFYLLKKKIQGQTLSHLARNVWKIPALFDSTEQSLHFDGNISSFEIEHTFSKIGYKKLHVNACRFMRQETNTELLMLVFKDITGLSQDDKRKG
jgi:two-component system CheB/CheR fusion protein